MHRVRNLIICFHAAHTQVNVSVLDINDHAPTFDRSTYSVDVPENTAAGMDVFTVTATDLDEDRRLFYTIHSATSQASLVKFKINSETG